jgi:putative peptidoglycan lipid II flippase
VTGGGPGGPSSPEGVAGPEEVAGPEGVAGSKEVAGRSAGTGGTGGGDSTAGRTDAAGTDGRADTADTDGTADAGGRRGRSGLLRSSAVMAAGTLASRVTGFLRTAVLASALGTQLLGDAYNIANTIPNILYDLLLGGLLTSVVVPLLVRAKRTDADGGVAYEQRFFTLAVLGLALLTATAVLLAPLLISAYAAGYTDDQRELAVTFARFFLPQIFFYGMGAFAGAILNTRDRFGAPMWAPVLNNLVMIAVGGAFIVVAGGGVTAENISSAEVRLLGIGTTAGIVLQTLALWPSLRAAGFRWRPRFDFRWSELTEVGRMGAWSLVYVIATQISFLVIANLTTEAGEKGQREGIAVGVGYTPFNYAYMLFQLPYAIVAVSVITALLPRMSAHAAERRDDLVRDDCSTGLRLSSAVIVPSAALLLGMAAEIAILIFAHHNTAIADALVIARVLQAFAIALVPFSAYQLLLRVFYAMSDTRTPALVSMVTVSVNIAGAVVMSTVLPTERIVVGIALALGVANAVGAAICWLVLRARLGRLDGRRVIGAYLRLGVASAPAFGFAYGTHLVLAAMLSYGTLSALLTIAVGSLGGGLVFIVAARMLKIAEVDVMVRTVMNRIPGRASR